MGELGDLLWWFVRYIVPSHHLRIRVSCAPGTVGSVIEKAGEWSRRLRRRGLITHAGVETYHPETARFGGPTAMQAAEAFFAADSAAVLAQLAFQVGDDAPDIRALTAASMVDIAIGLLGDEAAAMRWLIKHTRTDTTAPPRAVYRQAVDLVSTTPTRLDTDTAKRWSERRTALAAYREALSRTELHPNDVLADLLHLHHVRVQGPGPAEERGHLHLARAAALSWTARRGRTT
jgi:thiopeptide-type bacteriocin biosynthesis protein